MTFAFALLEGVNLVFLVNVRELIEAFVSTGTALLK